MRVTSDVEVGVVGGRHDLHVHLRVRLLRAGAALVLRPLPRLVVRFAGLLRLDALEPLVEEELVARGGQQRRRRRLDADADDALVELAQLVHQRREVAVAGAEHERGDVVALEAELDRVDRHLDVGRVLADHAHALRHLDQLDLVDG